MTDDDRFNSLGAYYYMLNKCYDPLHRRFDTFGAKGAEVCSEWRGDREQFVRDMGAPPSPGHYVKRTNENEPFSPQNCIWFRRADYVKRTPAEKKAAKEVQEQRRQSKLALTDAEVKDILRMVYKEGVPPATIPLLYPVSIGLIRGIVAGTRRPVKGFRYGGLPKQPRGRAGQGMVEPDKIADIRAFRASGASIAQVAARFDISESYAYKLLPGEKARTYEENRVANAVATRKTRALERLKSGTQPKPDLAVLSHQARKAKEKREFEARVAALKFADLL